MARVVDELGLVLENEHLVVYLPAFRKALVFRVVSRVNRGYEILNYGPLPLSAGQLLPTYDGGSATVPADGVIPGRAYTREGLSFPYPGVYDETDMWFTPVEKREILFHVVQEVTPLFLRVDVQIPKAVHQNRFQKGKLITGIEKDFGFTRGRLEVVHLPGVHYGFRYGNDTNVDLHTSVRFTYGEYEVEIPRSPELIFNLLTRRAPAHWLTLPVNIADDTVRRALVDAYGIEGFPLYSPDKREEALEEYEKLVGEVKL